MNSFNYNRRYIKKIFTTICCLTLATICALAQNNTTTERLWMNYSEKYPAEKVYLHTDRTLYKPGDDVWFALYLTDANGVPGAGLSNAITVELVSPKGNVEQKLTAQTFAGLANNVFTIGNDAPGGVWKIKAYTNWMKNWGDSTLFEKNIYVQKVVTPTLLMKLDFDRKAYSRGDHVSATLEATTLENEKLSNYPIDYTVMIGGEAISKQKAITDKAGKAVIKFALPQNLSTNDGLLNVMIDYNGTNEAISRSIPIVLNKISLAFFPEGGDMCDGVEGKVAFKALNEFHKPADVDGYVFDDAGNRITTFRSFHFGMGAFSFAPSATKQYYARLTSPSGIDTVYKLPAVSRSGYALGVDTCLNDQVILHIHTPAKEMVTLALLVGEKIATKSFYAPETSSRVTVPVKDFPYGVMRITLLNAQGLEMCERLVYYGNRQPMNITVSSNKKTYLPGEPVTLTIKTMAGDKPLSSSVSLATVDDKNISFADDRQENILSWLMMSSELKDKVEEPSFYFNPEKEKAAQALDLVLLTHGWRRFIWNDVLTNNMPVKYLPVNSSVVNGQIIDKRTNNGIRAKVWLMETQWNRRIQNVETTNDGHFMFVGVNPKSAILFAAKAPKVNAADLGIVFNTISNVPGSLPVIQNDSVPAAVKSVNKPLENAAKKEKRREEKYFNEQSRQLSSLNNPAALNDVVVVGYGSSLKKNITSSVMTVHANILQTSSPNLGATLAGYVPGIDISRTSSVPASSALINIRGTSSLTGTNGPLCVVDGIVCDETILSKISPGNIDNISILKSADGVALYGARAANGVIVITSKTVNGYLKNRTSSFYTFYQPVATEGDIRQFYSPVNSLKQDYQSRSDFRTTLYWNPIVHTNENGEATLTYYNSDEESAYRIIAEGISTDGKPGRGEYVYNTQLPFSLTSKLPAYFTFGDTVNLPVIINNHTKSTLKGYLSISHDAGFQELTNAFSSRTEIPADSFAKVFVPLRVNQMEGRAGIRISFFGDSCRDAVSHIAEVLPKGFEKKYFMSSAKPQETFSFNVTNSVSGTPAGLFTLYIDPLGDLMKGVEGIFAQPHGCFEQVSSSTYPNIMALKYLKSAGKTDSKLEKMALGYIEDGYKKLAAYETRERGFEWYGGLPPHEGLTAYGIMELTEMKDLYPAVSSELLQRSKDWLLKRRDGKGHFRQNKGRYAFSYASRDVNDAYIVYCLSECGEKNISAEYETVVKNALATKDPYLLALAANAAYNFNNPQTGEDLVREMDDLVQKSGLEKFTGKESIVRSYGKSLNIETVSLYALALMKQQSLRKATIAKALTYIATQRSGGMFGASQSTVLALKAITQYASVSLREKQALSYTIKVNDHVISNKVDDKGITSLTEDLSKFIQNGPNKVSVSINTTGEIPPYGFDFSWRSAFPDNSEYCKVNIKTKLSTPVTKVGETVRLTTSVTNKMNTGLPMCVAVVGIPAGLSPQMWQLKEMQEKEKIDYFELTKNNIVFYFRGMDASETRTLNVDLRAETPGNFEAPASSTYLYYTDEFKNWWKGEKVEIKD